MKKLIISLFALTTILSFADTIPSTPLTGVIISNNSTASAPTIKNNASTTVQVNATIVPASTSSLIISDKINGSSISNIVFNHNNLAKDKTEDSTLIQPFFVRRTGGEHLFYKAGQSLTIGLTTTNNGDTHTSLNLPLTSSTNNGPDKTISTLESTLSVATKEDDAAYGKTSASYALNSVITKEAIAAATVGEYTGTAYLNVTVNN